MKNRVIFRTATMLALSIGFIHAQRFGSPNAPASTTVTDATGTISQLNYGNGGNVQGFLLTGGKILLLFPGNVTGGVSALGAVGNSVTYSGSAATTSAGFESVRVTSFTNTTTKATYTAPTATSATYGPTSGKVEQLNYQPNGSVDGFVFAAGSGAPILVTIGRQQAGSTLSTALVAGATVTVTGTSHTTSSTTALTVVNASQLVIDGQTFVFSLPGFGFGGTGHGPGPGSGRGGF
jgi:hypothetical protein